MSKTPAQFAQSKDDEQVLAIWVWIGRFIARPVSTRRDAHVVTSGLESGTESELPDSSRLEMSSFELGVQVSGGIQADAMRQRGRFAVALLVRDASTL